jgi:hypothetical protein
MVITPWHLLGRPDRRASTNINAGGVPIRKNHYFSVAAASGWRILLVEIAASWSKLP